MIYPKQFPINNINQAEKKVFLTLDKLDKDKYDIFYSRKFTAIKQGERSEYEADFIVADIRNNKLNGILVIEVKGGNLKYNGESLVWTQNGHVLKSGPTDQSVSILHSLMRRFEFLHQNVPMGWAVWFPDMINPGSNFLPTDLNENQYLDSSALFYPEQFINSVFKYIHEQWPHKRGDRMETYYLFKEPLIRSLGYALPLHKKIEAAEIRFLELTEKQLELLRLVSSNPNILVTGPAGSGKTIMATTIAREQAELGKKVLLLTFNRVLANNIRHGLGRTENPEVANYHALAKKYIDQVDKDWWASSEKNQEFWELEVPLKMMEALECERFTYDVIVVDEGQDLRTEWFETLELLIKPEGGFFIFKDSDQDIFHSNSVVQLQRSLFNFDLKENCRNTVQIIEQLKEYTQRDIAYKADAVDGEPVRILEYTNDIDQMNKIKSEWLRLVEDEHISPNKILIMMNADKRKSCLSKIKKFGKYKVEALHGRTGQLSTRSVNYTSINTFKGLETDIVFIIDTDKVEIPDMKVLYAQASRAKYLLYILKE